MEQIVTGLVDGIVVPVTSAIVWMVDSGAAFVLFLILWVAVGAALIRSRGDIEAAWAWLRARPFVVQLFLWLLFLPVLVGLWVYRTTWPIAVRLVVMAGIAGWNLLIFLPRAAGS